MSKFVQLMQEQFQDWVQDAGDPRARQLGWDSSWFRAPWGPERVRFDESGAEVYPSPAARSPVAGAKFIRALVRFVGDLPWAPVAPLREERRAVLLLNEIRAKGADPARLSELVRLTNGLDWTRMGSLQDDWRAFSNTYWRWFPVPPAPPVLPPRKKVQASVAGQPCSPCKVSTIAVGPGDLDVVFRVERIDPAPVVLESALKPGQGLESSTRSSSAGEIDLAERERRVARTIYLAELDLLYF